MNDLHHRGHKVKEAFEPKISGVHTFRGGGTLDNVINDCVTRLLLSFVCTRRLGKPVVEKGTELKTGSGSVW